MEINILHLYYDLLNLYGENGNIKALKKHLEEQNVKVNIEFLTLNDKIDFKRYDFVYFMKIHDRMQSNRIYHDAGEAKASPAFAAPARDAGRG